MFASPNFWLYLLICATVLLLIGGLAFALFIVYFYVCGSLFLKGRLYGFLFLAATVGIIAYFKIYWGFSLSESIFAVFDFVADIGLRFTHI